MPKAAQTAAPNFANRTVYTGDCLDVMRRMNSGCVDLIYLDPPFNKKKNFQSTIKSPAEGTGFKDFWSWSDIRAYEADEVERQCPAAGLVIRAAFHAYDEGMAAYIVMMANRLMECRRVLKKTGSIYLHCDHTAAHYLKLLLDGIFGKDNFMNDISWCYTSPGKVVRHFPRKHDNLLFYTVSGRSTFNTNAVKIPYSEETLARRGRVEGESSYISPSVETQERRELQQVETKFGKGKIPEDWWINIAPLTNQKERVGYATQKPLALLERIIAASSNPGDLVLDPFCGCATTLIAAEKLGRRYCGIDISKNAAPLLKRRLAYESEQGNLGGTVPPMPTVTTKLPVRDDLEPELKSAKQKEAHKQFLYKKQRGECRACKEHFGNARHFQLDRIAPGSEGGTYHPHNLQLLCGNCNAIKGARPHAYLMKRLRDLGYIGDAE